MNSRLPALFSFARRIAPRVGVGAGVSLAVIGALLAAGAPTPAQDAVPVAQPITRYQKILDDSPFRKPTEATPAPTPPPKPGWADDLFVGGVMSINGKNVVKIVQRSDSQSFTIASGEDNPQGLNVVNVQFSDTFNQTRVTVKKGNEFGVLLFDQNAASARAAAPVRIPPNPGAQPGNSFTPPGGNVPRPPVVGGNRPPAGPTPPPMPTLPGVSQPIPGAGGVPPPDTGFPRQRPRPLIKAEPNAQPTPPPAQRALPGRAEVLD